MIKDSKVLLEDILFSVESIEKFVKNVSKDEFGKDLMIQDAVIRRFAVIGEAANKMPQDIKDEYKDIEWKSIVTMRNFLLHEYFNIDLDIVWNTIKKDLPKLKTQISAILKKL